MGKITDTNLIEKMEKGRKYKGYFMEDDEKLDIEFPDLCILLKQGIVHGESS
jgi:phage anti-repressor protein